MKKNNIKPKNILKIFNINNTQYEYFLDSEQKHMLESIKNKENSNIYAAFRSISGVEKTIERDVLIKKILTENIQTNSKEEQNDCNKNVATKSIIQTNSFLHMTIPTVKYFIDHMISKRKANLFDETLKPTLCELILSNCRFYMDIESMKTEINSRIDWDILTKNVVSFIKLYLPKYFLSEEQREYQIYHLVLDSSSKEKFSRHLIFYVYVKGKEVLFPEHLIFKDFLASSLVNFKDAVAESMEQTEDKSVVIEGIKFFDEGNGISEIFVCSEKNGCVIDLSVYTSYRNMRIACCAKIDGERYLLPIYYDNPHHPGINKLIDTVNKHMKGEGNYTVYTETMKPNERYNLLSKINTIELHEVGLINRFTGWDNLETIKITHPTERIEQNELKKRKIVKPNQTGDLQRINANINRINKIRVTETSITDIFRVIRENLKSNHEIDKKYSSLFEKDLKTTEIYEDGSGISFLSYNKHCLLLSRPHKNNHSVTVLSTTTLGVYQWCFDEQCKKKVDMFNLMDILPINKLLEIKERITNFTNKFLQAPLTKEESEIFIKKLEKESVILN